MPKVKSHPYLYLGAACLVGLAVWLWEAPTTDRKGDVVERSLLEEFDFQKVSLIEAEHLLNGVKLKKEGEGWKVTGLKSGIQKALDKPVEAASETTPAPPPSPEEERWFKADKEKVEMAFDILDDTTLVSLVGNNPNRHGQFEVNASGEQLRVFDAQGKKLAHLYFGRQPGMQESFVRREGENDVYLANRFLRTVFSVNVETWRDRTVWEIPQVEMEEIQVQRGKNAFTLKRVDGNWKLALPNKMEEVNKARVDPFVLQTAKITATGFEEKETAEMKLNQPDVILTVKTAKGSHGLVVRKEEKGWEHFAKKGGDEQVYRIADTVAKAIPSGAEELIAKPAETPKPEPEEQKPE